MWTSFLHRCMLQPPLKTFRASFLLPKATLKSFNTAGGHGTSAASSLFSLGAHHILAQNLCPRCFHLLTMLQTRGSSHPRASACTVFKTGNPLPSSSSYSAQNIIPLPTFRKLLSQDESLILAQDSWVIKSTDCLCVWIPAQSLHRRGFECCRTYWSFSILHWDCLCKGCSTFLAYSKCSVIGSHH